MDASTMPWLVAAQPAFEYDDGLSRIVFLNELLKQRA